MNLKKKPVTRLRHLIGKNWYRFRVLIPIQSVSKQEKHWKAVSSYGADDVITAVTVAAAAAANVVAVAAAAGLKVAFISFICFYFTLCKSFEALTSF